MNSKADVYVRSLREPVKRRFAGEYLAWLRKGRVASMPARGGLSGALAKAVCTNLDELV